MDASSVVIKVKYADTLRRFNAKVVDGELDLSMGGLTEKIFSLFNFSHDTEITLTYIDEDGDSVALVDDDDLCDVVKQSLNPLRITVKLNLKKNGTPFTLSTGTSTPLRSPRVKQSFRYPITGVSKILKTVPQPLRETLVNLSTDLVSKVSSTAPVISPGTTELINYFSKVGLSYLDQLAESQTTVQPSAQSDVPENSYSIPELKDSDSSRVDPKITVVPSDGKSKKQSFKSDEIPKKLQLEETVRSVEVKAGSSIGGIMEASSSKPPGTNAVAGPINSKNIDIGLRESSAPENPNPRVVHLNVGNKEKAKMINDCNHDEKLHLTFDHQQPVANPGTVGVSDPLKGNEKPLDSLLSPTDNFNKLPVSGFTCECPFSRVPVENVSATSPQPAPLAVAFNRSRIQNDGCGTIFHRGVCCDGCGVHPITGPRFKSKIKVDYDLCSICFAAMGNDNDYFKIDYPAINRHQLSFKGFHDHHARRRCLVSHQIQRDHKVKPGGSKLDSRFIQDVNILDGTAIAPLIPFTKIWRMRNNGTLAWPQKTHLVWIGGDKLSNLLSVELEILPTGLTVDHELDVAMDFISPALPGCYISYWRLASPSGQKFGQRVWVLIQVDATLKETSHVGVQGLNLNLPPVNSILNGPEIINLDLTPLVEDSRREHDNSNKMVEIVDPVFRMQLPNNEQEMKFPITDGLLVGNGASTSAVPASTSETYPIIDLSEIAPPAFSTPTPSVLYPSAPSGGNTVSYAEELPGKEEVENKLLRELEEMGFKQVDLNKEVLRMNEYDLEQAVDDLCEVAGWDPMLDELQEMGFRDSNMNKKLLKKNNGSIKRVVMDLIAGEEQQ